MDVTTRMATRRTTEIAYERAYDAHWSDVFRFALAWTNDWAAAEDLAQEAYIRLWNQRAQLDWSRPVRPWLLVTTRRLATDRFRALRRRLLAVPEPATLDASVQDRWLDVAAAMADLSPLERAALVMTAIEGATYDEAAMVLGTTRRGAARRGQSGPNEVGDRLMDPTRPDRILEEWDAVASAARQPAAPPRRRRRAGSPGRAEPGRWRHPHRGAGAGRRVAGPAGSGRCRRGRAVRAAERERSGRGHAVGAGRAAVGQRGSVATSVAPSPSATPAPTAVPTVGPCAPGALAARITSWEGAAGNRIAEVVLRNTGSATCVIGASARPQLVDSKGLDPHQRLEPVDDEHDASSRRTTPSRRSSTSPTTAARTRSGS